MGETCEATEDCKGDLKCSERSRTCVDELGAWCEKVPGCQEAGGCVGFHVSVPHDGKGRKGNKETAQLAVCVPKADSDSDCEKVCRSFGLCSAVNGVCAAVSDQQCQASVMGGNCGRNGRMVQVSSKAFSENTSYRYCWAIKGVCVGFEGDNYKGGYTPFARSVGGPMSRFSKAK